MRELEDGTVLLHDFAACGAADVVAAVGLELRDLFPERPTEHRRKPSRAWLDARDALVCLAIEGQVLAVAAANWQRWGEFGDPDRQRISIAAGRIHRAWEAVNGSR